MIDVDDEKLTVRVQSEEVQFNVFKAMKHPKDKGECFRMDVLDEREKRECLCKNAWARVSVLMLHFTKLFSTLSLSEMLR